MRVASYEVHTCILTKVTSYVSVSVSVNVNINSVSVNFSVRGTLVD